MSEDTPQSFCEVAALILALWPHCEGIEYPSIEGKEGPVTWGR
jgi:hypothetical protein